MFGAGGGAPGTDARAWQPFVDDDQVLQTYFPDRRIAIIIPIIIGLILFTIVTVFIALVMIHSGDDAKVMSLVTTPTSTDGPDPQTVTPAD